MTAISLFFWCLLLLSAIVVDLVLAAPVLPGDVQNYSFDSYLIEFGKYYESVAEYLLRQRQFEKTKRTILQHNTRRDVTFAMGFNFFADLTETEVAAFLLSKAPRTQAARSFSLTSHVQGSPIDRASGPLSAASALPRDSSRAVGGSGSAESVPDAFTWQNHTPAVVTAVKTQGLCGSCWAHAAAATVESAMAVRFRVPARAISVEQITACANNTRRCGGEGGCYGGTAQLAFAYAASTTRGLLAEDDYPYTSGAAGDTDPCLLSPSGADNATPVAWVRGHVQVERNRASATVAALLRHGPLAVTVDATDWVFYDSGVFSGCGGGVGVPTRHGGNITMNHAVQLVGYGVDSDTNVRFWIVRNSWGSDWGEAGYMRLARAAFGDEEQCAFVNDWNEVGGGCLNDTVVDITACGTCGILYDVAYPIVDEAPVPGGTLWWLPFAIFTAGSLTLACAVTWTFCRRLRVAVRLNA